MSTTALETAPSASIKPPARHKPVIPSGLLGMLIFIVTEAMFFAALISAYLIVRSGAMSWPPPGQPRLPVEATAFNTVVLLLSGLCLAVVLRNFNKESATKLTRTAFNLALAAGTFFIVVQGVEWIQLLNFGLTLSSSTYGSFFYLIVGIHGLHAAVTIAYLGHARWLLKQDKLDVERLKVIGVFWYFVVGLWPILYALVYLY